jgi:hypothetical protein
VLKKLLSSFSRAFSHLFSNAHSHTINQEMLNTSCPQNPLASKEQNHIANSIIMNQKGMVDIEIKMSLAEQPAGLAKAIKLLQLQSLRLSN